MKARAFFVLVYVTVSPLMAEASRAESKIDPTTPMILYNFKVDGEFSGGEDLWINKVYLGKMPLSITLNELQAKVPLLTEPPEGYSDENRRQLNGHWFKLRLENPLLDRGSPEEQMLRAIRILKGEEDDSEGEYYMRVKLDNEWGSQVMSDCGGGGDAYRRDYSVTIRCRFPAREEQISAKEKRFQTLLQIARYQDYQVGTEWFRAMDTYGDQGWRDLMYSRSGDEKLLDGWACWKFQIDDLNDVEIAQAAFKRVCTFVNARKMYRFDRIEGHAIELIHDKLDLSTLVKQYKRILASGKRLCGGQAGEYTMSTHEALDGLSTVVSTNHSGKDVVQAETSAIFHALRCWDIKLDRDDYSSANPVELEVVPALILYDNGRGTWFEQAVQLGGPVMARFVFRQNWHPNTSDDKDRLFGGSTHGLNRWCVYLAELDDPAGRKFRQQHASILMDMADKICEQGMRGMNDSPPAFLFLDNDLGQQSLAWKYWERFSAWVAMSKPSWAHQHIARRFRYFANMGDVATLQMYLDAWHETHRVMGPSDRLYMSVNKANTIIPEDKREAFERYLLEYYQDILKKLENNNQKDSEEHIEIYDVISTLTRCLNAPTAFDLLDKYIKPYPTAKSRAQLDKFLQDSDPKIQQAAQEVWEALNQLEDIPLETLVAYPDEPKL